MSKHLPLPTDGSSLSNDAIEKGIRFAKDAQAQVTGIHVMPDFHTMTYRTEMLEDTESQFAADCRARARTAAGKRNNLGPDPQQDTRARVSLNGLPERNSPPEVSSRGGLPSLSSNRLRYSSLLRSSFSCPCCQMA